MSQKADTQLFSRLSLMMFLQYAIWGAWLPLFWGFMKHVRKFDDPSIGILFGVGASGALFAPFIAGQIADRWFNTEKFLGLSHILGGILVWQLATIESYNGLLVFAFLYSLIYSPTIPLTNSLAFHHLPDRDRDFGKIRVWGTVGWIAVGIGVGQWRMLQYRPEEVWVAVSDAFALSAILGIAMGFYCFTLPKTPPKKGERLAFAEAWSEIRASRALIVLFLLSLPMSIIHQFYFAQTEMFLTAQSVSAGWTKRIFGVGGGPMTIGQIGEIIVLAAMPLLLTRFPKKNLMIVGLLAYILRFAAFAYSDSNGIILAALALHGVCFGGWFFIAFLLVDEKTTSDVRASAQGLYNLIVVGIGVILGNLVAGEVGKWASISAQETDWSRLFSVPLWATVVVLAAFIVFYPKEKSKA